MKLRSLLFAAGLTVSVTWCLAPPAWQLITSLKPQEEIGRLPPIFPHHATLDNYRSVLRERPFPRYLLNSLAVATLTMLLALALGAPAAYAVSRLQLPGARWILWGFLAVAMFPPISIVGPLYLAVRWLALRDTWWSLVVADTSFVLPLTVWLLCSFFQDIPRDLLRAARVDGASAWGAFIHVAVPAAAPGIGASAILAFVFAWNEFLFALAFTSSPVAQTIPVGVALFAGVHEVPWAEIAAASLLAAVPVLGLILAFQRRIVQGVTAGAVKE